MSLSFETKLFCYYSYDVFSEHLHQNMSLSITLRIALMLSFDRFGTACRKELLPLISITIPLAASSLIKSRTCFTYRPIGIKRFWGNALKNPGLAIFVWLNPGQRQFMRMPLFLYGPTMRSAVYRDGGEGLELRMMTRRSENRLRQISSCSVDMSRNPRLSHREVNKFRL